MVKKKKKPKCNKEINPEKKYQFTFSMFYIFLQIESNHFLFRPNIEHFCFSELYDSQSKNKTVSIDTRPTPPLKPVKPVDCTVYIVIVKETAAYRKWLETGQEHIFYFISR